MYNAAVKGQNIVLAPRWLHLPVVRLLWILLRTMTCMHQCHNSQMLYVTWLVSFDFTSPVSFNLASRRIARLVIRTDRVTLIYSPSFFIFACRLARRLARFLADFPVRLSFSSAVVPVSSTFLSSMWRTSGLPVVLSSSVCLLVLLLLFQELFLVKEHKRGSAEAQRGGMW